MKIKAKLIPITILTTASTIVPIGMTSCSSMKEIYGMSAPTFEQYGVGKTVTEDEALQAYVDYMSAHTKAFIEDMKWGVYQNWMSFYENSNYAISGTHNEIFNSKINSLKCDVSKPKFGNVQINTGSQMEEFPTLSFKMKIEADVNVTTAFGPEAQTTKNHSIKTKSEIEYKNMLFFAYPATRNDKTHGTNYISPSDMLVDTTKPGWFITISEDSDTQFRYRKNFSSWGIKYKFDFEDKLTEKFQGSSEEKVTLKKASFSNEVDTYKELERLIDLKTYHYEDPTLPGSEGPNEAWYAWFNQEQESVLANSLLLDCVTHYLDKCDSECYMYVPEHLTADFNAVTLKENLQGALYYPKKSFNPETDLDKYEITLEIYDKNQKWEWVPYAAVQESDGEWTPGLVPTLVLYSGSPESAGPANYKLLPDWDDWMINKGAAKTSLPAEVSNGEQVPQDKEMDLRFLLGSQYKLVFNLHQAGATGQKGEYGGAFPQEKYEVQLNDGNGTVLLHVTPLLS